MVMMAAGCVGLEGVCSMPALPCFEGRLTLGAARPVRRGTGQGAGMCG